MWPGRTGPVADVLYSAAGNSADEHWYNRGIFGWDFEVGADLWDPEKATGTAWASSPPSPRGFQEAMEFSNGLVGLFEVASAHGNDVKPPTTTLVLTDEVSSSAASEPVSIHYTLDGSASATPHRWLVRPAAGRGGRRPGRNGARAQWTFLWPAGAGRASGWPKRKPRLPTPASRTRRTRGVGGAVGEG